MNQNDKPAPPPAGPRNIQLELGQAEGQGTYANLAVISQSAAEIVIDFARVVPGVPKAKVYSRVLMTPFHAKALHRALGDNLEKFEAAHGVIKLPTDGDDKSIGFR